MPPLNALKAFEATARLQSITRAAVELHVTPGAVSQQVKILEEYLGVTLFIRTSRKLQLTDLARSYLDVLTESFSKIQISTQDLFDTVDHSFLQVRCGTSFAQRWLVPKLPDFAQKHPQYRMRLQTAIWPTVTSQSGVDVELSHGYGTYSGLSIQRILKEHWIVVASASFAQKHGCSLDLEQLLEAPLLSTFGYREGWQRWFSSQGVNHSQIVSSFEIDNSTMALDMTLAGMGVMLGLDTYLQDKIVSGELVQVHPYQMSADCGLYLVLPNQGIKPKTKDFCLWLFAQLAEHPNRDNLEWLHS
ncbi:MAG: LysR family transcriptional regulator [Oceanospirillaceae bacterium]|nr:LysR family transcriptional regulator [Oceanospirillaceae bacterium]